MRRVLISIIVCCSVSGCVQDEDVSLVVEVLTDLVPGHELSLVEAAAQVEGAASRMARTPIESGATGDVHRVADWSDLSPDGSREVQVRLFGPSGDLIGERRLLVSNRVSQAVRFIYARSCLDVECGPDRSCLGGVCVDPACLTGAEPECVGLQCDAATCVASSACDDPVCADGVCLHRADATSCDASEVCLPSEGCVPRSDPVDAGPAPADGGVVGGSCRPPRGACDYVDQDCPADGSCVPQIDSTAVVSVCVGAGASALGANCGATGECARGLVCHDAECTELCCPGEGLDVCSQGTHVCRALGDGFVGYCLPDELCDPFQATGCAPPLVCYERMTTTETDCLEAGSVAEGEVCTDSGVCAPGMRCTGRCRPLCADACPGDLRCVTVAPERYGACYPNECDPITQLDCAPDEGCYPTSSNVASCLDVIMPRGIGEACVATNNCEPGATCANLFCRDICAVGGVACPRGGERCTAFMGPTPRLFGACLP